MPEDKRGEGGKKEKKKKQVTERGDNCDTRTDGT